MKEFIRINVKDYVINGIASGDLVPFLAIKYARVRARQGVLDEVVNTYTDGGVLERKNKVSVDPVTGRLGWVITKCSPDGEIIIDEFGNKNEWIMSDSSFCEEYQLDPNLDGVYKSVDGPQMFVQVLTDITMVQGSKEMNIEAGGYINITDIDDCYGISDRDFDDTYRILEDAPKNVL